jgi:hypothetical protein
MALGSTQTVTEMSTKNLPGGKGWPARKADNLTAICEPIVKKIWELRRLTTLWASTACYRDSFTSLPMLRDFNVEFHSFTDLQNINYVTAINSFIRAKLITTNIFFLFYRNSDNYTHAPVNGRNSVSVVTKYGLNDRRIGVRLLLLELSEPVPFTPDPD